MPIISTKGQLMPESPIRKLVPFAEKAYKANKKVYHLNIGQPDIKSPKQAMEAVASHALDVLAYTRSEGSETYRTKIATRSEEHTSELQSRSDLVCRLLLEKKHNIDKDPPLNTQ